MTWIPLLKLDFTEDNPQCVFYRIPHKDSPEHLGILKVVSVGPKESCHEKFEHDGVATIEGIEEMMVVVLGDEKNILNHTLKVRPFHLALIFKKSGSTHEARLLFPLYNLLPGHILNAESRGKVLHHKAYKATRFSSSAPLKLGRGITLYKKNPVKDMMGDFNDSYPDRSAVICHDVGKDCVDATPYQCQRCRFGYYEVVRGQCPQGGPKFCGINHCGQKGWPACPRGFAYAEHMAQDGCFAGSMAGYCEKGLVTFCDENNVLICL